MVLIKYNVFLASVANHIHLHSNMVLIKLNLSLPTNLTVALFTFQYGSNQIRYILNIAIATYTDILFVYLQINIYFPK